MPGTTEKKLNVKNQKHKEYIHPDYHNQIDNWVPNLFATAVVVPLPLKGSKIISPG